MSADETILRVAAKGDGVTASGRHVAFTAPGDVIRADGSIVPGASHATPPCRHFGKCGACELQQLDEPSLAGFVYERVVNAASGQGLEPELVAPAYLSPQRSRRRATLHADRGGIGFRAGGSHKIVDMRECHVLHPDPKDDGYYAQMVRANVQPHKDWLIASNRRHQMRLAWAEFFKDWDVLLCPNAATAAFPHSMPGERWERMISVNGKSQPVTTQMWWAGIAGMCYLPGTAAPIGLSPEGLPLSVQVVGPQYGDLTTIRFAQLIEREYYAFAPPPAYG